MKDTIVFDSPNSFFKWLWNYEGELTITENKDIYEGRKLVAKLGYIKNNGSRN